MKILTPSVLTLGVLCLMTGAASAQILGEPAPPHPYDAVADMRYHFERGAPTEGVREAQRVLHDTGYYAGPLDGVVSPALRRAVWNFQKAQGLLRSGRLNPPTVVALGITPPVYAAGHETPSAASPALDERDPGRPLVRPPSRRTR